MRVRVGVRHFVSWPMYLEPRATFGLFESSSILNVIFTLYNVESRAISRAVVMICIENAIVAGLKPNVYNVTNVLV